MQVVLQSQSRRVMVWEHIPNPKTVRCIIDRSLPLFVPTGG